MQCRTGCGVRHSELIRNPDTQFSANAERYMIPGARHTPPADSPPTWKLTNPADSARRFFGVP